MLSEMRFSLVLSSLYTVFAGTKSIRKLESLFFIALLGRKRVPEGEVRYLLCGEFYDNLF